MQVDPLTKISSPVTEIYPNCFLTNQGCKERVFLHCRGPTEHTIVLVDSILQVYGQSIQSVNPLPAR